MGFRKKGMRNVINREGEDFIKRFSRLNTELTDLQKYKSIHPGFIVFFYFKVRLFALIYSFKTG
jgi:hypothetical protein